MTNKRTTIAIVFASVIIVAVIALFIISASVNNNDVENTVPQTDDEDETDVNEALGIEEEESIFGIFSDIFGLAFYVVIGYFLWSAFIGKRSARRLFREIFE